MGDPTTLTEAERAEGVLRMNGDDRCLWFSEQAVERILAARLSAASGAMQGLTEKAARPGNLPDDPTPWPDTPGFAAASGDDLRNRWDYENHPGDCHPRREPDGTWTVCCRECAGTGVFPVPWIDSPAEGRADMDRCSDVRCKGTGRAVIGFAAAGDDLRNRVEAEAMERASSVFGWQHLARYSRQSQEWLDLTLGAMARAVLAAPSAPLVSRPEAEDELRTAIESLAEEAAILPDDLIPHLGDCCGSRCDSCGCCLHSINDCTCGACGCADHIETDELRFRRRVLDLRRLLSDTP